MDVITLVRRRTHTHTHTHTQILGMDKGELIMAKNVQLKKKQDNIDMETRPHERGTDPV